MALKPWLDILTDRENNATAFDRLMMAGRFLGLEASSALKAWRWGFFV
jgi:hypothetical protein